MGCFAFLPKNTAGVDRSTRADTVWARSARNLSSTNVTLKQFPSNTSSVHTSQLPDMAREEIVSANFDGFEGVHIRIKSLANENLAALCAGNNYPPEEICFVSGKAEDGALKKVALQIWSGMRALPIAEFLYLGLTTGAPFCP